MLLAKRLVEMIEKHAQELTAQVISELKANPRTVSYHNLALQENRDRVFNVLCNLGEWLDHKSDSTAESLYRQLGHRRFHDAVPLAEVVYALMLTKQTLCGFIHTQALVNSAIDLYQQIELYNLIGRFFDRAIYFTMLGYEQEAHSGWKPTTQTQPHKWRVPAHTSA